MMTKYDLWLSQKTGEELLNKQRHVSKINKMIQGMATNQLDTSSILVQF